MTEQQADALLTLARLQIGLTFGVFVGILIVIVTVITRHNGH